MFSFTEIPENLSHFIWKESFYETVKNQIIRTFDIGFDQVYSERYVEIEQLSELLEIDLEKLDLALRQTLLVKLLKPQKSFFLSDLRKAESFLNKRIKALKKLQRKVLLCKKEYTRK